MAQSRPASKRNRRRRAAPLLGAAGLSLSLAGGAAAATGQPPTELAARNAPVSQRVTLAEEEISGVSLATFHVFDKENAAKAARGTRFAMGVGGCGGCAGCGGCWTGTYYTSPVFGGNGNDPPHPVRPAHKYAHPSKRTSGQ